MIENSIYNSITISKTGISVPIFCNKKPMFSLYKPEQEVQYLISDIINSKCSFVLLGGIGNGLHISLLREKCPNICIIAVEYNNSTLEYVKKNFSLPDQDSFLTFCTIDTFENTFFHKYNPLINGNLVFKSIRSWNDYIGEDFNKLSQSINKVLSIISSDVSTQASFARIWHKNILHNLSLISKITSSSQVINKLYNSNNKKAAIIGAGPTLNQTIDKLQKYRNEYYIISTDTAFQVLIQKNIIPDAVVSIDGQYLSLSHFTNIPQQDILYVLDICVNYDISELLISKKKNVLFTSSGHPLGTLAENWFIKQTKSTLLLPHLQSGGGTVLHSATDFACKLGFRFIEVFGADFSYPGGKPYVSGTYLDTLYYSSSNLLLPAETSFTKLLFRTKQKTKSYDEKSITYTSDLLDIYKKSFTEYMQKQSNCDIRFINIDNFDNTEKNFDIDNHFLLKNLNFTIKMPKFEYKSFIHWYLNSLRNKESDIFESILPLSAWIKKHESEYNMYDLAIYLTEKIGVSNET